MSRQATILLTAAGLLLFTGCGSSKSKVGVSRPCDSPCGHGLVCSPTKKTHVTKTCQTTANCNGGGEACISQGGQHVCSRVDCDPDGSKRCPIGQTCTSAYKCVTANGGPDASGPGSADAATDALTPRDAADACTGEGCAAAADACTGEGCAAAADACTGDGCGPTNRTQGACKTCASDAACPKGLSCKPLTGGKYCLAACKTDDDCTTGWKCQGDFCTPGGYQCTGCLLLATSCKQGEVCNTNDGSCMAPKAPCDSCTYPYECGPDADCVSTGPGTSICEPRCGGAHGSCAASATCKADTTTKVQTCQSKGSTCCYKDDPTKCTSQQPCNPACGGATPICLGGSCVQCTKDADCTGAGETCDTSAHTCSSATHPCTGSTPYLWNGKCVQCLDNTACPSGQTCDTSTGTCGGGSGACSCQAPYPACAQINGSSYCVQCTKDADCGQGGTCDKSSYTCQGGTVTPANGCKSDSDCVAGQTRFTLQCDTSTGYCYDTHGGCDGVTAFCKLSMKCVSLISPLLGGAGGGGGIPGMPGGAGMTIPGSCACDASYELAHLGKGVCGKALCGSLSSLIALLGGRSSGSTPNDSVCISLSAN